MVASVSNITSASSAVQYFEKDGYYSKNDPEHRKASHWVGQGAEQLGLTGHIDPDKFRSVLKGYVPKTDIRLGRIRDGEHEHRPGVDLTLSAPKSVSLEALVHGNDLVQSAHDAAMRATLDFVEERIVQTRVWNRTRQRMERVYAPTLVAATFRHAASRNLDPQLHTHCVIANMTRGTNGKWRSIETGDLKRNDKLIGAFYRNELARRLRQLGFALAPTMVGRVPGFEIAGRDRVALEAFSSRRKDMLDYIAEKGWEYNAARTQQAALATRLRKDEPHWEVLTVLWRERAAELGIEKTRPDSIRETAPVQSPLEIVWQVAEHLEVRPSVSVMRELARETGIACRTLQGFLAHYRDVVDNLVGGEQLAGLRKDFAGSILVVDEMSQSSTEQTLRLIMIADRLRVGRLVLVGDRWQLRAVGAGQPFRQLRDAGMQTALMDDIRRQRNPGLKATALDVIGSAPEPTPGQSGENLYQVPADELGENAARIWLELLPASRARTAILAPTRALREQINETVREGFEEEGMLHGREIVIETLVGLGLTQAQKNDIRNWHEGDIAVFHNDLSRSRIRADDICTVTAVEGERVWLHHPDGKPRHISPAGSVHYRLELCEAAPVRIRAGDRIRWTRNDNDRGLAHGEQAAILTINHNTLLVRTDDGRTLRFHNNDPQLRYIEHAYASSMHTAQRLARDDVIIALDSGHGRLSDQQMFYLKICQTRENAVVLTDNHEQLIARHYDRHLSRSLDLDMDMGL